MRPAGRPVGASDAKERILQAAQNKFSELGYDHTTVRLVAVEAGVDSALVFHYFATKYELFLAAILPFYQGPQLLQETLGGLEPDQFGPRMAQLFCRVMDTEATQKVLVGLIRASTSEPKATELLASFIEERLIFPIADYLKVDQSPLKAAILGSQLVGLFMTRYVVRLEPIASASSDDLARLLKPLIQAYLD